MPTSRRGTIPAAVAAHEFQASNDTSNRFLGTSQRSWMQPGYQPSSSVIRTTVQAVDRNIHTLPTPEHVVQPVTRTYEAQLPAVTASSDGSLPHEGNSGSSVQVVTDSTQRARPAQVIESATSSTNRETALPTVVTRGPLAVSAPADNTTVHPGMPIDVRDEMRQPIQSFLHTADSETQMDQSRDPLAPNGRSGSQIRVNGASIAGSEIGDAAGSSVGHLPEAGIPTPALPVTWQQSLTGPSHISGPFRVSNDRANTAYGIQAIGNTSPILFADYSTSFTPQAPSSSHQTIHNHSTSMLQGSQHHVVDAQQLHQQGIGLIRPVNNFEGFFSFSPQIRQDVPVATPPQRYTSTSDDRPNASDYGIMAAPSPVGRSPRSLGSPQALENLQKFEAKIAALRRNLQFDNYTEMMVNMVQHAIHMQDHFYLTYNQLVCLWIMNPTSIQTRFNLGLAQLNGLHYLGLNLIYHFKLPQQIVELFSKLEAPELLHMERAKQALVGQVKNFLYGCETRLRNLWDVCARGQAPPSASVVAHYQRCEASPVFQRFFFELIFKKMFDSAQHAFFVAVCHLFEANQMEFFQKLRQGLKFPSGNVFAEPDVQAFRKQFEELRLRFRGVTRGAAMPDQRQNSLLVGNIIHSTRNNIAASHILQNVSSNLARPRPTSVADHINLQPIPVLQSSRTQTRMPAATPVTTRNTASGLQTESSLAQSNGNSLQSSSLLPPEGYRLPITVNNNSDRTALHQAHLNSPQFIPADVEPSASVTLRVYTFFEAFLMAPKVINADAGYLVAELTISPDLISHRVKEIPTPENEVYGRRKRVLNDQTLMFRLRCVALTHSEENLDETNWLEKQTHWPECCFFSMNGDHIETRRRIHFQKDLSADVSAMVREGQNKLEVSYHSVSAETDSRFAVAIEVIRVVQHDVAAGLPRVIHANVVLEAIMSTFSHASGTEDDDDDDVTMIDSHISIDLIDPFTSQICRQPVRGRHCRHRECFDLQAFLRSRVSKGKNGVISPDSWQCPICRRDARPCNLVLDGFLLDVSEQLASEGKTGVRAILINRDGTWSPRAQTAPRENSGAPTPLPSATMHTTFASSDSTADRSTTADSRPMAELGDPGDSPAHPETIIIDLDND